MNVFSLKPIICILNMQFRNNIWNQIIFLSRLERPKYLIYADIGKTFFPGNFFWDAIVYVKLSMNNDAISYNEVNLK